MGKIKVEFSFVPGVCVLAGQEPIHFTLTINISILLASKEVDYLGMSSMIGLTKWCPSSSIHYAYNIKSA